MARPVRSLQPPEPVLRSAVVHGYRRAYRVAGEGPPLLLIHGIGDDSSTWLPVMSRLARRHLVIAPDLLGHGRSDKPRADYSVAAYANGMRDLLGVLGIESATLIGHSLGGGVAMQFAYQFPERTQRLVLVSSGGVGREVTPVLRAVALPGSNLVLSALRLPGMRLQTRLALAALRAVHNSLGLDAPDFVRLVDALPDPTSRSAFIRTLRAVVDWRGQVVTMLDRCYLTQGMPTMLIWGDHDGVLPVEHAYAAHDAMPDSRLEIFTGSGHFPFHTEPDRFVQVVEDFLSTTDAAGWSVEQWRRLLRAQPQGPGADEQGEHLREQSERSAT